MSLGSIDSIHHAPQTRNHPSDIDTPQSLIHFPNLRKTIQTSKPSINQPENLICNRRKKIDPSLSTPPCSSSPNHRLACQTKTSGTPGPVAGIKWDVMRKELFAWNDMHMACTTGMTGTWACKAGPNHLHSILYPIPRFISPTDISHCRVQIFLGWMCWLVLMRDDLLLASSILM